MVALLILLYAPLVVFIVLSSNQSGFPPYGARCGGTYRWLRTSSCGRCATLLGLSSPLR
jgi:ABC-type spermidine/putrescine transport system permease subunit II